MKTLLLFLLFSQMALTSTREFQSTSSFSAGGTGVASIESIDATVLNPAGGAFAQDSKFYAGYTGASFLGDSKDSTSNDDNLNGFMAAVYDSTDKARGGFLYQRYTDDGIRRNRIGTSMAMPVGKLTSLGSSYFYNMDKDLSKNKTKKFHQVNLGMTSIISQRMVLGIVANDILNTYDKEKTVGTVGLKYALSDTIQAMSDVGYNYRGKFKTSSFYKFGTQINFMDQFALRGGYKVDKYENAKGFSAGLAWNAGKLAINIGYSDLKRNDQLSTSFINKDESLKEINSSLVIAIK